MFYKETRLVPVWYHKLSERIEVTCHEEGVEPLLISQFLIYLYHHKWENGTICDDSTEVNFESSILCRGFPSDDVAIEKV